jgi:hypothetical protein
MSIAFSTEGRVAFRVTVTPRVPNLSKLIEAVFKTGARVSHAEIISPTEWQAIVWLKVVSVPRFESIALPKGFEFVATRDLLRGK